MRLSPASLDWALANVEAYGDTDIFPPAFEFAAIRHTWDEADGLRTWLARQDLNSWNTRPYRRCLSPKHRYGFRISTQLDPLDTLIYSALMYEIGSDIEARRIPCSREIVHSYRFSPDPSGLMFSSDFGYDTFIQKATEHADSEKVGWVVVADIADFFARLYSHPFENALRDCTLGAHADHANAIRHLINQWNFTNSYGIPVGPAASRLLSELAIADVDEALLSEGQVFCRYSDDYLLFCQDIRQAHVRLAFLANVLFENHGLTLQTDKTKILSVDDFRSQYISTERREARASLTRRFQEILDELGLDDPYEEIEYDRLDPKIQKKIDALNLRGILEEQLHTPDSLNALVTRFVLRRLAQLDDPGCVDLIVDNIESLYVVFKDALEYVTQLQDLEEKKRHSVGSRLLDVIDNSVVGHLEYHRCWVLHTFTRDRSWNQEERFATLMAALSDEFSRRELILALGRARAQYWFKTRKRDVLGLGAWERRAFLAAASCLPGDEATHWYRSMRPRLDELEKVVVRWAQDNPFG